MKKASDNLLFVLFSLMVILAIWGVAIFFIPIFDGYGDSKALTRIKIMDKNDSYSTVKILQTSALWDQSYLWSDGNGKVPDTKMLKGKLPEWVKEGNLIIMEGGGYWDSELEMRALYFNNIYKNSFQPFGVDWRWTFWITLGIGILLGKKLGSFLDNK